jgi:uncharacterized membrane protein
MSTAERARTGRPATLTAPEPVLPRWAAPATVGTSLVGLVASIYLTVEHFTASATLACPETGVVNCQRVTTSAQSTIAGVPWALLGAVFFAGLLLLGRPAAWRSRSTAVRYGRLALAVTGVASVIYLISVELFVVNAICLWCTVAHVAALAVFGVVCFATASSS